MNIFYLHPDPYKAAEMQVDSHVVKMTLETTQLLCTAHRILDPHRRAKHDRYGLYKITHRHHPSAVWCRKTDANYEWLHHHLCGLLEEYTYRYGRRHKCEDLVHFLESPPEKIPEGVFTPPTPAMDAAFRVGDDVLLSYRNYYRQAKKNLHSWTNRQPPEWINEADRHHNGLR